MAIRGFAQKNGNKKHSFVSLAIDRTPSSTFPVTKPPSGAASISTIIPTIIITINSNIISIIITIISNIASIYLTRILTITELKSHSK